MSNTQIFLAAAGLVVTLIVTLWGMAERNTNRLIEQFEKRMTENATQMEKRQNENAIQFEKRMNERDEKLLAEIRALRAEMTGEFKAVNLRLDRLEADMTKLVFLEKRVDALERKAA